MSSFNGMVGQPKKYTIGGVEVELRPRGLEDIELMLELSEVAGMKQEDLEKLPKIEREEISKKRIRVFSELIRKTLKDAGATDEEIKNIKIGVFKELSEAIVDVNGLKE